MATATALVNIFGNAAYVGLLLTGLWHARKRDDLLRQERAFKLYAMGAVAMILTLSTNLTRENWADVVINGFNLAVVAIATYLTGKRCDQLEGIGR